MFKPISEFTFGKTPAAQYLARVLNIIGDEVEIRITGKRITATTKAVNELVFAYEDERISAKTLANTLRLMREEITSEDLLYNSLWHKKNGYKLVEQLRRNVQIGHIKQGIRLATVARKAQRVMVDPENRASGIVKTKSGCNLSITKYMMNIGSDNVCVGNQYEYLNESGLKFTTPNIVRVEDIAKNSVNADILHERSDRRCKRLQKPHTISGETK